MYNMFAKFILALLFIISMLTPFRSFAEKWSGEIEKYEKGIGTSNSPFLIEKPSHLAYLVNSGTFKGKFFKVTNDLDFNEIPWVPICSFEDSPFQGAIDFDYHHISNLNVETSTRSAGLFGYVRNAKISNLTFDQNCIVKGDALTAMLVGYACDTELSNIVVRGKVQSSGYNPQTGGVLGCGINVIVYDVLNYANVIHSTNVQSGSTPILQIGGIVGFGDGVTLKRCANFGYIQGYDPQALAICEVGGIVGSALNGSYVSHCFNQGEVVGRLRYVRFGNNGTKSYVGGIVGGQIGAIIQSCYNTGLISGESYWSGKYACIMSCDDWSVNDNYTPLKNCFSTWEINGCQARSYTCNQKEFNGQKASEEEINSKYIIELMNNGTNNYLADRYPWINNGLPFFNSIKAYNLVTEDAKEITATSALLKGSAHYSGYDVDRWMFRIKNKSEEKWTVYETMGMSYSIDKLEPNSTYDYQFGMITSENETIWSKNIIEFKTSVIFSEAFTICIDEIYSDSAIIRGAIVVDDTEELISYGIRYRSIGEEEKILYGNNLKDNYFTVTITHLEPETQYEVRTFANLNIGEIFGDKLLFYTSNAGINQIIQLDSTWLVYNLKGENLGEKTHADILKLPQGIYFIRSNESIKKIVVK